MKCPLQNEWLILVMHSWTLSGHRLDGPISGPSGSEWHTNQSSSSRTWICSLHLHSCQIFLHLVHHIGENNHFPIHIPIHIRKTTSLVDHNWKCSSPPSTECGTPTRKCLLRSQIMFIYDFRGCRFPWTCPLLSSVNSPLVTL